MALERTIGSFRKIAGNIGDNLEFRKLTKNLTDPDEITKIGNDIHQKGVERNAGIDKEVKARRTLKDARRNPASEDVVNNAIEYQKKANEAKDFMYDGARYKVMPDGTYAKGSGKKGKPETIEESEFLDARGKYAQEQYEAGRLLDFEKSGPADYAGIGFVQNHPGVAAAIAGGVGLAGGALLLGNDDDDEYEE